MIKGPGKNAGVNKNKLQQIINSRKLYVNLNGFLENRNKNYNYTIWNNNHKMAGFALLKPNKNELNIEFIVTKAGTKGYGKALINKIKINSKNTFNKLKLTSLPSARNFYIKQGFVPNGTYKMSFMLK